MSYSFVLRCRRQLKANCRNSFNLASHYLLFYDTYSGIRTCSHLQKRNVQRLNSSLHLPLNSCPSNGSWRFENKARDCSRAHRNIFLQTMYILIQEDQIQKLWQSFWASQEESIKFFLFLAFPSFVDYCCALSTFGTFNKKHKILIQSTNQLTINNWAHDLALWLHLLMSSRWSKNWFQLENLQ